MPNAQRYAETISPHGSAAYDTTSALPLAFDALLNRVGDLVARDW